MEPRGADAVSVTRGCEPSGTLEWHLGTWMGHLSSAQHIFPCLEALEQEAVRGRG